MPSEVSNLHLEWNLHLYIHGDIKSQMFVNPDSTIFVHPKV